MIWIEAQYYYHKSQSCVAFQNMFSLFQWGVEGEGEGEGEGRGGHGHSSLQCAQMPDHKNKNKKEEEKKGGGLIVFLRMDTNHGGVSGVRFGGDTMLNSCLGVFFPQNNQSLFG